VFERRLRTARKAAGWTQTRAAEVAGVSDKTWRCWESDKDDSLPRLDQVAAFCRETGIHPLWLILGEGEMFREPTEPDLPTRLAALPAEARETIIHLIELLEEKP